MRRGDIVPWDINGRFVFGEDDATTTTFDLALLFKSALRTSDRWAGILGR
jgi:hypothetical protein